jgi:hypothetical protein
VLCKVITDQQWFSNGSATMTAEELMQQMVSEAEEVLADLHENVRFQERYVATLREKLDRLRVGMGALPSSVMPPRLTTGRGQLTPPRVAPSPFSMPERIVEVLRKAGCPMRVMDITAKLEEAGVQTNAKKGLFPNVGSALVRRADLFVKKDRGLYGLKEWETASAKRQGGDEE